MRVLYLNHTAQVSGGERSLLDLLPRLPADVAPTLACPEGPLADAARALGVPVLPLTPIEASLKLSPRLMVRAVTQIGRCAVSVRAAVRSARPQLLHANSIRAGLALTVAGPRLPPAVVHVRDTLPPTRAADLSLRAAVAGATATIANSGYTEARLLRAASPRLSRVVYSPVDTQRFDPERTSPAAARAALALDGPGPVLAVVGQLTPWKGQETALRALALVRDELPGARLLLAGSAKFTSAATRFDNASYVRDLEALVAHEGLSDAVRFLGERGDVEAVIAAADVLLVPSWEEPFGRVVVEGMAMRRPVVATNVGGPAEIVRDGVDGVLLAPRDPGPWAEAVARLGANEALRARMGASGHERAVARFGVERHAADTAAIYREVLALTSSP